ncbi:MAG: energy transducer TonB [Odoribacter sp.]
MEVKKSQKADLEGKKGLFFEIGLTLALAVLLFAFEWKSSTEEVGQFQTVAEEQIEEEIIPITQQMLKPPPPPPPAPKLTDLIDIVEDDVSIDEELEIQDAEDQSENKAVENVSDFGEYGTEDTGETEVFVVVEDMPSFPLGNVQKWISKNVKYPVLAAENGIQGKVYIQFVIEKDGSITDVKVIRGVDASLDKEASRVIQSMPKWKPGKQRGKPVRVSYTLPINFQLSNN